MFPKDYKRALLELEAEKDKENIKQKEEQKITSNNLQVIKLLLYIVK